jgi:HSP20 family molecular chaperone IbpA
MFERKKCKNCGEKLKDSWEFCPNCGIKTNKRIEPTKDIFDDFEKEFEKIDKNFGFRVGFPKVGFRPKGGVSIVITSGEPGNRILEEHKRFEPTLKRKPLEEKKPVRIPKVTIEPETKIEKVGNKQIIKMTLPGVKNRDDIEIKRMEQSIEIKAFAGDTAYFKLIPIPSNASVSKEFDKDTLKIEVQK